MYALFFNRTLKNNELQQFMVPISFLILVIQFSCGLSTQQEITNYKQVKDIEPPTGFQRISADPNSFAAYLQQLPIKQGDGKVYLYDGQLKGNQSAQFAILDIDVGTRDLQQCADAAMRLRGEYLFHEKQYDDIHFNFLGDGLPRYFKAYANGDYSYQKFRKYMDYIFAYANTRSLHAEMIPVAVEDMQIGDVFIQTGNPYGHAVTVIDIAENLNSGERVFMLCQSYMPAQDIHILKNPNDRAKSPWYSASFLNILTTPEWDFGLTDLRRYR